MKALKITGIVLLVLYILIATFMTIFFIFSGYGAGADVLKETFADGFFAGIKSMFVEIWNGIKIVFKA
jgi:hypothetical protein